MKIYDYAYNRSFFSDLNDMRDKASRVWDYDPAYPYSANLYNPTVYALERQIALLENAQFSIAVQTGQAAITTALMTFGSVGKTILIPDNVYGPVRLLLENQLRPLGITATYYNPARPEAITKDIWQKTALLYLESPGSHSFEIADLDVFVSLARTHAVPSLIDATWATPLGIQPLALGIDMVLHSLSKTMSGGANVFGGVLSVNDPHLYKQLKNTAVFLGHWLSPDDASLIMAGLVSLPERLAAQQTASSYVRNFIENQPLVTTLLCAEKQPNYARFFTTGSSLFSFILDKRVNDDALRLFLDKLHVIKMSMGWGGPRSLLVPITPQKSRAVAPWLYPEGQVLRLYVGREDTQILHDDLEQAFTSLNAIAL